MNVMLVHIEAQRQYECRFSIEATAVTLVTRHFVQKRLAVHWITRGMEEQVLFLDQCRQRIDSRLSRIAGRTRCVDTKLPKGVVFCQRCRHEGRIRLNVHHKRGVGTTRHILS